MPSSRQVNELSAPSPARAVALSVLIQSQRSDESLETLMDRALSRTTLEGRDRALSIEIAYGVLRRLGTIDWRLRPALKKPLARLPTAVQMLLRLGAYQLLFLDRVPASAAVWESVNLAKAQTRTLKRDWSGFVNAVLRALIREPSPPWPSIEEDAARALAVRHSVPEWLSRRWVGRWGTVRAQTACEQVSEIPPLTLRVNRLEIGRDEFLDRLREAGLEARATRVSPVGVTIEGGSSIPSLPGFADGQFYVEDEAAQLIPPLLDVHSGDLVLDACAAPGGKSTHLAELMNDTGRIYAVDRSKPRLEWLDANRQRLRHNSIFPIAADVRDPSWRHAVAGAIASEQSVKAFDRILVDAPCSGLGVLRRHPEAKWRKTSGQFERHHAMQIQILEAAAVCLRPGGVLVYSTCSTEAEENEAVIDQFLRSHSEFQRESVASWLPMAGQEFLTERGDLCTVGNRHSMDAFYAARLKKTCS
ncbi:MAG TPA: 16S rRNA (cytosine(967)-C(5))-methyltransferase RsmB [Nitrospira sp.]|nr:16S rRNA (cytosine(967)-C(5))-methyltransferase RsmB [Nitrospira sp.]